MAPAPAGEEGVWRAGASDPVRRTVARVVRGRGGGGGGVEYAGTCAGPPAACRPPPPPPAWAARHLALAAAAGVNSSQARAGGGRRTQPSAARACAGGRQLMRPAALSNVVAFAEDPLMELLYPTPTPTLLVLLRCTSIEELLGFHRSGREQG